MTAWRHGRPTLTPRSGAVRPLAAFVTVAALFACGDDSTPEQVDEVPARAHVVGRDLAGPEDPDAPPPPPMNWAEAHDLLSDREAWLAATSRTRRAAVDAVAVRLTDFRWLRLETFSCGGVVHPIALFAHAKTGLEFALVPGGTFVRGSPAVEPGHASSPPTFAEEAHTVVLRSGFLIARTEVTQAAWDSVMDSNPSYRPDPRRPVDSVSWNAAREFCARTGLSLPTEAQWEYACRAGTRTAFAFGDDPASLAEHAWFADNSEATSHWVAGRAENAFGLFDLHGNVLEWCEDVASPYPRGAVADPASPAASGDRACRGGSWFNEAVFCRSAARSSYAPDTKSPAVGFRVTAALPAR
jgi:formylglycine-generating enzyme required for sulfatase activity